MAFRNEALLLFEKVNNFIIYHLDITHSFETNIYFKNIFQNAQEKTTCLDKIVLSKSIMHEFDSGIAIDHSLNNNVFMMESSKSVLVLSFRSCPRDETKNNTGFQVIVRNKGNIISNNVLKLVRIIN